MDLITTIKEHFFLPRFIGEETNQTLKHKKNGHYLGDCPFCFEKTLWANDNVCNCFRKKCAADKHMDVINFFARLHNLDNESAIKELARRLPSAQTQTPPTKRTERVNLATVDMWDLPDWLEKNGYECAGLIDWQPDPEHPDRLMAFLPVREVSR